MTAKKRVGVLISGRGSNLQALIDAARAPDYPAELVRVISNVPDVQGLTRAEDAGIATSVVNHKDFVTRQDFEAVLEEVLNDAGVELLCNAGFMRLLTGGFVTRWLNRHLNIHPSLLPAFKGLHTHERVLESGARITGCTVHFVRAAMDDGPIVAQAAVPVNPEDIEDSLAARVLKAEHRLYPHALRLVAAGKLRVEGEHVVGMSQQEGQTALFSPPLPGTL
ncbi:MAG TPA: phosphoribosylglycinamide formyltransferase [Methyloceanibacter sp.]|nr:phosphoribosylglycinamide formyltransferase [Methyloceanibacter sp.]